MQDEKRLMRSMCRIRSVSLAEIRSRSPEVIGNTVNHLEHARMRESEDNMAQKCNMMVRTTDIITPITLSYPSVRPPKYISELNPMNKIA